MSLCGQELCCDCERLKKHFLQRRKKTKIQADDTIRLAGTIGRLVSRYRRENPDTWKQSFEQQMRVYRSLHVRDSDWLQEQERYYTQWLATFEQRQEFEWVEAAPVVAFARLYHEQHNFDQAITIYREAIKLAGNARMNREFRRAVLDWLDDALRACQEKADPLPDLKYRRRRSDSDCSRDAKP